MGDPLNRKLFKKRQNLLGINPSRCQEHIPDESIKLSQAARHAQLGLFKQHAPGQRVAVTVQPRRGQPDDHIPGHNVPPINDLRTIHGADRESGQIIFPLGIE